MATITKRKTKGGKWRFTAQIRIRRGGKIIHTEAKTFPLRGMADTWGQAREIELAKPGAVFTRSQVSLSALIDRYIDEFEASANWGRSKKSDLRRMKGYAISEKAAADLSVSDLVQHVRQRIASGAKPPTVKNDLIWISTVFKTARAAWGEPVSREVVLDAMQACRDLRMVGPSRRRERRVKPDELQRLLAFLDGKARGFIPMGDIVRFAVASARRQDEICRLRWDDLSEASHTILVRDVKHPTDKAGNHQPAKLTAEALTVIHRQPRVGELIFPYESKSVSSYFTRACKMLEIEDLHFHDLRHEATSRLFEAGYSIPEVAQFTLHRSWKDLQRYTQLRPEKMVLRK